MGIWRGAWRGGATVLVILVLHAAGGSEYPDPECPCIQMNHTATFEGKLKLFLDTYNANGTRQQCGMGEFEEFPLDYGVGACEAWDLGHKPFCDDSNDDSSCSRPWCYVNETLCRSTNKTLHKSAYFPCDYYYSYTACESSVNLDDDAVALAQVETVVGRRLEGFELRVGVPALFYADHYRLNESGTPILYDADIREGTGAMLGIFIDFLSVVAQRAGFKVKFVDVSGGSLTKTSSRWTGCAYDVRAGLSDLCIGNFWVTSERRAVANFASSIFNEGFYLLVPAPSESTDFLSLVTKIFEPFSTALWLSISSAVVWTGIVYCLVDRRAQDRIREEVGSLEGLSLWQKLALLRRPALEMLLSRVYTALFELLGGAPVGEEGRTTPQKVVIVGWGFFIVTTLATYTANLAAFLTVSSVDHKISSLDECIAVDCQLCVPEAISGVLASQILANYPAAKWATIYGSSSASQTVQRVIDGRCDAAILGDWTYYQRFAATTNCKVTLLEGLIASIPVAWPSHGDYATALSYWLLSAVQDGTWASIYESYTPTADSCQEVEDEDSETTPIGPTEFVGPLIILSFLSIVAIFLHLHCSLTLRSLSGGFNFEEKEDGEEASFEMNERSGNGGSGEGEELNRHRQASAIVVEGTNPLRRLKVDSNGGTADENLASIEPKTIIEELSLLRNAVKSMEAAMQAGAAPPSGRESITSAGTAHRQALRRLRRRRLQRQRGNQVSISDDNKERAGAGVQAAPINADAYGSARKATLQAPKGFSSVAAAGNDVEMDEGNSGMSSDYSSDESHNTIEVEEQQGQGQNRGKEIGPVELAATLESASGRNNNGNARERGQQDDSTATGLLKFGLVDDVLSRFNASATEDDEIGSPKSPKSVRKNSSNKEASLVQGMVARFSLSPSISGDERSGADPTWHAQSQKTYRDNQGGQF